LFQEMETGRPQKKPIEVPEEYLKAKVAGLLVVKPDRRPVFIPWFFLQNDRYTRVLVPA